MALYVVCDIEDLRITRYRETGEHEDWRWRVECPCGYKGGPFVTPEMANQVRDGHDHICLWPR